MSPKTGRKDVSCLILDDVFTGGHDTLRGHGTDSHRPHHYGGELHKSPESCLGWRSCPRLATIGPAGRRGRVPEPVEEELKRLKGLYDGFQYCELCRILLYTLGYHVSDKTVKKL